MEKTKTVFALTQPGDPLRKSVWTEFAPLIREPGLRPHGGLEVRLSVAETFLQLIRNRIEFHTEMLPILLRTMWFDDIREVRELASRALLMAEGQTH